MLSVRARLSASDSIAVDQHFSHSLVRNTLANVHAIAKISLANVDLAHLAVLLAWGSWTNRVRKTHLHVHFGVTGCARESRLDEMNDSAQS